MEFPSRRQPPVAGQTARKKKAKGGPGDKVPRPGVCTLPWSLYTCGIARAGVGCPRLHLGLGNVRPPRGRCLGLCPRRLRPRSEYGCGALGCVQCRLAQGCRGQLDDSPQSLGVGPEGAAQEQPNVERWVIRARTPEETIGSHLDDEDRRDVYKLQSGGQSPPAGQGRALLPECFCREAPNLRSWATRRRVRIRVTLDNAASRHPPAL